ncbi:MAG: hypothetical protein U0K92_03125 [Treponema sp.]|nr:hypothetical protein [Treponema sp.]
MNEKIEDLISIGTDIGEVALDSVMEDGILKDIPIAGNVYKLLKLGKSFSDTIMLYKCRMFVNNLQLKTKEEIEEFKNKYLQIKDYQAIGSKIILFLNSSDDEKKVLWLSNSLKALVDSKINKQDFLRLTMIINGSFPDYVEQLKYFNTNQEITSENKLIEQYILEHLYSIGCLSEKGFDGGTYDKSLESLEVDNGTIYVLSKFGKMLLDYII